MRRLAQLSEQPNGAVQYRSLLQRSTLHCYFTRPYVTSWSLFEAAASGARLCVNQTEATQGVVKDPERVLWVDLDDETTLTARVIEALEGAPRPRCAMAAEHRLDASLHSWQELVNAALTQNN